MSVIQIDYNGKKIDVHVILTNCRCVQIVVRNNLRIDMLTPVGMTRDMAEDYIKMNYDHIVRTYEKKKKRNHQALPVTLDVESGQLIYYNGMMLPFLGNMQLQLKIKYINDAEEASWRAYQAKDDDLWIIVVKTEGDNQEFVRSCLMLFYRENTKKILQEAVSAYGEKLNLKYQKIGITGESIEPSRRRFMLTAKNLEVKNQMTLWGRCSWKKELTFDWKLSMLPMEIIEYVIVHELTHLKKMNHSSGFWKLIDNVMPEYRECRAWLEKHGKEYEIF